MTRDIPAAHAPGAWTPDLPITTERLMLLRDIDDLVRFHSGPETVRHLPGPVRNRDETQVALEKKPRPARSRRGRRLDRPRYRRASATVIGEVDLKRAGGGRAELGYVIRRDRAARGLASEAVLPLLRYAFDDLELEVVDAYITPDNEASIRLAERQGFRRDPARDAERWDDATVAFTLTRHDWTRLHPQVRAEVSVRPYRPEDAAATLEIFLAAILVGARDMYSEEQRLAWLGDAPRAPRWHEERTEARTIVAELAGVVVGFTDLRADGYIDRLFAHPSATRRGVGSALLRHVAALAESERVSVLRTHASRAARPVFERAGFIVDHAETVERAGVALERFAMHRDL